MAQVELLLAPLPVHVRTARMVGVAAARRAGLDDDYVADLRLALGEACSRAVALHVAHAVPDPVRILVRDDPTGLIVTITDRGPATTATSTDPVDSLFGDDGDLLVPDVALAVLSSLVDDVEILPDSTGTTVQLRWPLPPRAV